MFDAARQAQLDILPAIARGDFAPLLAWLGAAVHGRGSFLTTAELIAAATGRGLDPAVFQAHLKARYLG